MADRTLHRPYVAPHLQKHEHLADVAGGAATISGKTAVKGGCFKSDSRYVKPVLTRREKLKDITRVGATSGQIIG